MRERIRIDFSNVVSMLHWRVFFKINVLKET